MPSAHAEPPETPLKVATSVNVWAAQPAVLYVSTARYHAALPNPAPHGHASRARRTGTAACIAARENGGDYGRSSNPTHFGKYQYDRQTWVAHGGAPEDWGHASPAEQERVFAEGTARYGYSAWTPYDGC